MATKVVKLYYCALKQEPGKFEGTQIVPSRLQAGKGMIAHRIEGMFSHEGGNPYFFQDSLLKIAIIH